MTACYVAVLALLISALALATSYALHRTSASTYSERCSLYALTLTTASESWLSAIGQPGDQLSHPLLSLGVVYIRLGTREGITMDIRRSEFASANLPTPDRHAMTRTTVVRNQSYWAIDVAVPLMVSLSDSEADTLDDLAVLQFGIDASGLRRTSQRTIATVSCVALGAWVLASFAAALLVRRRGWLLRKREDPQTVIADASRKLVAGRCVLSLDDLQFAVSDRKISLTPKQAAVLEMLMSHPGRALSDSDFLDGAWQNSAYANSSDVKQQIYLIRKRLRAAKLPASDILVTVPGVGYKLAALPIDEVVDAAATDTAHS